MGADVRHARHLTDDFNRAGGPGEGAGVNAATLGGRFVEGVHQLSDDEDPVEALPDLGVAGVVTEYLQLQRVIGLEGDARWRLAFLSLVLEQV